MIMPLYCSYMHVAAPTPNVKLNVGKTSISGPPGFEADV